MKKLILLTMFFMQSSIAVGSYWEGSSKNGCPRTPVSVMQDLNSKLNRQEEEHRQNINNIRIGLLVIGVITSVGFSFLNSENIKPFIKFSSVAIVGGLGSLVFEYVDDNSCRNKLIEDWKREQEFLKNLKKPE